MRKLERWPHQARCLEACRGFFANRSTAKRDFFVQMATGTGKSLVMADLLAELGTNQRACVIVPKLDLMEQMTRLLEETLPDRKVSRVGTGWPADLTAEVFVCVRNSAWQLGHLNFDVVLLDEAHHYEPLPLCRLPIAEDNQTEGDLLGVHAKQVLALNASKRVFFSATLIQHEPDFDFDLRPAIQAGVIMDYTVLVPVLSEGDPRPALVEAIHNLPLARKILAFCNTIHEAKSFTDMLNDAGIAANHYNGQTSAKQRQDILSSFAQSEARGGIRVLVTVDVLSEGVDLPVADTCLFVAPRQGVRLRQCVGRVLRRHPGKVDAQVIAPPIVQKNDSSLEEEAGLRRLLRELAMADPLFQASLTASIGQKGRRVGILAGAMKENGLKESLATKAARVLGMRVFPNVLAACNASLAWKAAVRRLEAYKAVHGHLAVPFSYRTCDDFKLGQWVSKKRHARSKDKLSAEQFESLEALGFVWDPFGELWQQGVTQLQAYRAEHGDVLVPFSYAAADGFKLGRWTIEKRYARSKGKLSAEHIESLDALGFVWDPLGELWQQGVTQLQAYRAEHGDVLVPKSYATEDGFNLGQWVSRKRGARSKDKLSAEQIESLDALGFVWDPLRELWQQRLTQLQAYRAEHGDVLVPFSYAAADGFKLGRWAIEKRHARSKGKLRAEQIESLDALGFVWDPLGELWQQGVTQLQAYRAGHGDVLVPQSLTTTDGFNLGQWVKTQRKARSNGKLSSDQIESLDALGFVWDPLGELWQQGVMQLQAYRAKHGDVLVPCSYAAADGFKLGQWVSTKRRARSNGKLSAEQIESLDALGFVWDPLGELWQQGVTQLQAYRAEHGDVLVPQSHEAADGFQLGQWVNTKRKARSKGKLSAEQIESLDTFGFVWDPLGELWQQGVTQLQAYRAEHGDVLVPKSYAKEDGFNLGQWVSRKRRARSKDKLSEEQIESLDALGFVWDPLGELWQQRLTQLQAYRAGHGDVLVPQSLTTTDGFNLGQWVKTQRKARSNGKLSADQIESLDALGFVWDPLGELWQQGVTQLQAYRAEHGDVLVPFSYAAADGFKLGRWTIEKRYARSKGKLSAEHIESLDALGFVWDPLGELWQQRLTQLQAYRAGHGDVLVPQSLTTTDGFNLGQWVKTQRKARSNGKLSAEQIESLDALGFVWDPLGELWQQGVMQLQAYRAEHGDVLVPFSYAAADGFKLGQWVSTKRRARSNGKLSAEQIESLDALGFVWDPLGELWQQGVTQLQAYRAEHGDVLVPQSHEAADGFQLGQWVNTKRKARSNGKLSAEQIESLDALGFVWDPLGELWQQGVTQLQAYRAEHGDVMVPFSHAAAHGFNLGQWVKTQRKARSNGKLSAEQIESLDALGFVWDPLGELWQQGVTQLQAYKAEHGDVLVPQSHEAADGFQLGQWVSTKRKARSNGKLSAEQIESLDALGFVWDPLGSCGSKA